MFVKSTAVTKYSKSANWNTETCWLQLHGTTFALKVNVFHFWFGPPATKVTKLFLVQHHASLCHQFYLATASNHLQTFQGYAFSLTDQWWLVEVTAGLWTRATEALPNHLQYYNFLHVFFHNSTKKLSSMTSVFHLFHLRKI